MRVLLIDLSGTAIALYSPYAFIIPQPAKGHNRNSVSAYAWNKG